MPALKLGLIVRYEYIWARRAAGAVTGDKDRPTCVVATFRREGSSTDAVIYLPISHMRPASEEDGIELSDQAKMAAGLDDLRQWVLISECNVDVWPLDVRQLPREPGRFHYGHLPPVVFAIIRDRFVIRYRAKRIQSVGRSSL